MEKGEKCWSSDEERYDDCFQSVCDQAFDGADSDEIRTIWEGDSRPYNASAFLPSVDRFIEDMMDRACDEAGECSENWLTDVKGEQELDLEARLKRVIDEWADEHGHQPKFWTVDNVRELKIKIAGDSDYEEVK